ncbi:response regulator [Gorillibacterium sp. sgz500922]|uniref:response regulator n=1 Tax=Gorillibacterium sp. sgz500922 TaxID=3446694 RepID=UPI003F662142
MMDRKPTILVVDDVPGNIALLSGLLKPHYRVKVANNGVRALQVAKESPPDLILLDIMMPVMDGYETCRRLKLENELKEIPVIFLTAKEETQDESKGLEIGAVDYLTKPIRAPILLSRVKTHLELKQSRDILKDHNHFLEMEISRRSQEVSTIQEVTIMSMAALAEIRDLDTGNHIQRTKYYLRLLATHLSRQDKYRALLTPEAIDLMVTSAPLHDIGKVGIPDYILQKPGKLTAAEYEVMKTHTLLGHEAILRAEKLMNSSDTFLRFAKEIVLYHHERWDGKGYPYGLRGERIPLSARLMAVADVYDALTGKRVYKTAIPHEMAVRMIVEDSGTHFDPEVVRSFVENQRHFLEIHERYKGEEAELLLTASFPSA